jgi:hypothetical protein
VIHSDHAEAAETAENIHSSACSAASAVMKGLGLFSLVTACEIPERCKRFCDIPTLGLNEVQQLRGRATVSVGLPVWVHGLQIIDGALNSFCLVRRFPRLLQKTCDRRFSLRDSRLFTWLRFLQFRQAIFDPICLLRLGSSGLFERLRVSRGLRSACGQVDGPGTIGVLARGAAACPFSLR